MSNDPYVTGQAHREAVAHVPVPHAVPMSTPHAVLALADAGEFTSLLLTLHSRVEDLTRRAEKDGDPFAAAELGVMRTLLARLRAS